MRYWWVNQKRTYRHEIAGGYLWSPKTRANGTRNPYYEFMREVAPGDLVLSFAAATIAAFGIARSHAYEAPKPQEFAGAGRNWSDIGWRVDVEFRETPGPIRPSLWIDLLRPLLPSRYSPLLADGRGVQAIYLTELPRPLALTLADLIGGDVGALARTELLRETTAPSPRPELVLWEAHLEQEIHRDTTLLETDRQALVLARRGQGLFRQRVTRLESRCRVTHVDRPEHLRASHCKPWRDCASHAERLDPHNGLLLTPSIDHLFDRGFISFAGDGRLLVSPVAHRPSLRRMGVPDHDVNVGPFTSEQDRFLEFHRDAVFLRARIAQ